MTEIEKIELLGKFLKTQEVIPEDEEFEKFEGFIKDEFFSILDNIPLSSKNEIYKKVIEKVNKIYLMIKLPSMCNKNIVGILNQDFIQKIKLYSEVFLVKLPKIVFNNYKSNYFLEYSEMENNILIDDMGQAFYDDIVNIEKYLNLQKLEKINLNPFIKYLYIANKRFPFKNIVLHETNIYGYLENIDMYEKIILNLKNFEDLERILFNLDKKKYKKNILIYYSKKEEINFVKLKKFDLKIEIIDSLERLNLILKEKDKVKKLYNPIFEFEQIFNFLYSELDNKKEELQEKIINLEALKFRIGGEFSKNTQVFSENIKELQEAKYKLLMLQSSFNKNILPILKILEKKINKSFLKEDKHLEKIVLEKKTEEKFIEFMESSLRYINYENIQEYLYKKDYKNAIYFLKQMYILKRDKNILKQIGDVYYHGIGDDGRESLKYFQKYIQEDGQLKENEVDLIVEKFYNRKFYEDILRISKKYETPVICFFTGLIYEKGLGNQMINKEKALEYYKKASSLEKGAKNYNRLNSIINPRTNYSKSYSSSTSYKSYKSDSWCYITTATCISLKKSDNCTELNSFRKFRDEWLKYQKDGEEDIKIYYEKAPKIIKKINSIENAELIYKAIWNNYLDKCYNLILEKKYFDARKLYTQMVDFLEKEYLF